VAAGRDRGVGRFRRRHCRRVRADRRRYGCRYTRGPRRGLYANRNHASLECRGTHIVSADDDHTHPLDYVAVIRDLVASDPQRIWIFSERWPGDADSPLICPPELHRSGFGSAPADPSRCAAIADGASVFPHDIFASGLRYDETYRFGGLWYLWGKLLADRGWRITFSDRTFVWHHFWPDGMTPAEGRLDDAGLLRQQLLATTTCSLSVRSGSIDRSVRVGWAASTPAPAVDSQLHRPFPRPHAAPGHRHRDARCGSRSAPGART
jgi:hypothetical protein